MKYVSKLLLLIIFVCSTEVAFAASASNNEAADWIRQMSQAMEELTYEGTFIYLHGDEVETMSVVHDHDENGVRERLSSLNGEARVIIRDMDNVTCIWPGSKSVIVSKSQPRTPFPTFDPENHPAFADYYQFMVVGEDRVAGIMTQVVAMMPVDDFRYGYKLWVDKQTRLLLRSMLLDNNDRVIEQVMFTSLSFPESANEEDFKASVGQDYEWKQIDNQLSKEDKPSSNYVKFRQLPIGFNKISESMRPMRMNENPVRHAIVSDGVASVSIYIEYTDGEGKDFSKMAGSSSMGAMHVYSKMFSDGLITVVGEVPEATVKMVGDAIILRE